MNEYIYYDSYGNPYVLDEHGNKQEPPRSNVVSKDGEFRLYDDSNGHCALCGRLGCRGYGYCFR